MKKQSILNSVIISSFSVALLSACGGSGGSDDPVARGPVKINSSNWSSPKLNTRKTSAKVTNSLSGNNTWSVVITDDNLTSNSHLQVYLDTDNDPSTGFRFNNEVWSQNSGADYLIEDGILYKSLTNNSTWDWATVQDVVIQRSANEIKVSAPASVFSGLCYNYHIGIVALDSDWNIETYSPQSNSMSPQNIDYCGGTGSNTAPVISLSSTSPYIVSQHSTFIVPPATAYDAEDGDISNSITTEHNVNTADIGIYTITYSVKDSGGLFANPVERNVIVKGTTSGTGFTIDGLSDDWVTTTTFSASNGNTLKVSDDQTQMYLLVESANIAENNQFYFDSDNDPSTGFNLGNGSADYLLENSNLYKFTGTNNNHWSWSLQTASIPYIKNQNIIELSIAKSLISPLSNITKLIYVNLDGNWNETFTLANELTEYTLLVPGNVNQAPVANDDSSSSLNNAIASISVLNNDTDADNDPLVIVEITQPAHGVSVINGDFVSYTPTAGYTGTDTFNYTISDGQGHTATATVTVTVTSNNVAPIAVDDTPSTNDITPKLIDVLTNDTDADGDTLTITIVTLPVNGGTAAISGNKILYTPTAGYVGMDFFGYEISDGQGHTARAIVAITVVASNVAPNAVDDNSSTDNLSPKLINVLANDTDADGDTLTITIVTLPINGGTATITGNKILYTSNTTFVGTDTFSYTISDGQGNTATATVSVVVTAGTNNAPDAVEDAVETSLNTTIEIDVLANDTDPDGDTLTILSFTQPSLGSTTQLANGNIQFNPQGNVGSISFSYTVSDGKGGTDTAVVTIATYDPNDPAHSSWPVISDENITIKSGTTITLNVLANDYDPDGDPLILDQVDNPVHGLSVKINNGEVQVSIDAGYVGADIFWYGVHDGHGHNGAGRVIITVTP